MFNRFLAFFAAVLLAFAPTSGGAQSVQQSGTVTAGHAARWVGK